MRKKVSFTPRKHIHNPAYIDYKEVLKLIPKDWQKKIKQNTGLPLPDEVMVIKVMVFSTKRKWLEKNIAETQFKDLYRTLHQRKIIPQCQWINMKVDNNKIIRRSLRKSNGHNFSFVSARM